MHAAVKKINSIPATLSAAVYICSYTLILELQASRDYH